ncbi:DUF4489 domain-containing protein [Bacillus sp. C1]
MGESHGKKCKKQGGLSPQPLLLLCGQSTGNGRRVDGGFSSFEPTQLAFVTVDTAGLSHPSVKIEFSNNIRYEPISEGGGFSQIRIRYDLFKQCKGQVTPTLLSSWFYERNVNLAAPNFISTTDINSFHYCESCDVECYECCDYFVRATVEEFNNAVVTYLNSEISALVQESVFHKGDY